MIDFSSCRINRFKAYGGANGAKIAVYYNDKNYMLKFPAPKREKTAKSYSSSCLSEYLGCHIYQTVGIDAQQTLLGTYKNRMVVACEDFNKDGWRLMEFAQLKNTCISSSHLGYGTELESILDAMEEQTLIPTADIKNRFWDMFIVDAFLGNFDRHNGNWGILVNEKYEMAKLAPVYDCASCLYPKPNEQEIDHILKNKNEIEARIFTFPTSAIKCNGKKINYFEYISSLQNADCTSALKRLQPRIDMKKINQLIDDMPGATPLQKQFYRIMLQERKNRILDFSLKKAMEKSEQRKTTIIIRTKNKIHDFER